jgi:hypothetical protein
MMSLLLWARLLLLGILGALVALYVWIAHQAGEEK